MGSLFEAWWKKEGFGEAPACQVAKDTETLFRVLGGPTSRLYGYCYSFTNPTSVSSSDFDANIVKWGNLCLYVATFSVRKGTPLWVGRIDQSYVRKGEDDGKDVFIGGNFNAIQVWVDKASAPYYLTPVGKPSRLFQDKVVAAGVGHA